MARYNTEVKDYQVRMPAFLRRPTRAKTTDCTVQQGVTMFGRKKKNGCKLASTPQIRRSINATTTRETHPITTMAVAFPKIKLF